LIPREEVTLPLVTIWTTKANDLIRDIIVHPIPTDQNEQRGVIYSSWDGKIYCVSGENGSRIWSFKISTDEQPAENLAVVRAPNNEEYLAASFHNHIVLLDIKRGSPLWTKKSTSWIVDIKTADVNGDGIEEIILLTRRGTLQMYNYKGDLLFNRHVRYSHPTPLATFDINGDKLPEIIIPSNQNLLAIDARGHIIRSLKLPAKCYSLTIGRFLWDAGPLLLAGFSGGFYLIDNQGKILIKKTIQGMEPFFVVPGDVDGDLLDEIIIADWTKDAIYVFDVSQTKKRLSVHSLSKIDVGSNILEIKTGDIDGDGKDEILTLLDRIEKNFLIIKNSKTLYSLDSYPASKGLTIGDALGYGKGDIIVRAGRENVSLMIHVPRLYAPRIIPIGEKFNINVISSRASRIRLEGSQNLKISATKLSSKTRKYSIGHVTFSKYLCEAVAEDVGYVKLVLAKKKRRETLIDRQIIVASRGTISEKTIALLVHDEDIIRMKIPNLKGFSVESSFFLIKSSVYKNSKAIKLSQLYPVDFEKMVLRLSIDSNTRTRDILLICKRAIEAKTITKNAYYDEDSLDLSLTNTSNAKLNITVDTSPPIKLLGNNAFHINPGDKKTLKIPFKVKNLEGYKVPVLFMLTVKYKGEKEHELKIPLEILVINRSKIKERVQRLINSGIPKDKALETTAERVGLPKEEIIKILASTKSYSG